MDTNKNQTQMRNLLNLGLTRDTNLGDTNSKITENGGYENEYYVTFAPGQYLKHYSIVAELGRGGMGVVYHAIDTKLNRDVAVKVIASPKQSASRLLGEAISIAQLNHPNIVQIFEVHEAPIPFFTMELIQGISLDTFIHQNSKKLKTKEYFRTITQIFIAIAKALQFAHKKKMIHRDIKPENIMLDHQLQPKVMDFGLATIERDYTISTELAGTPVYMSPEQAKNGKVTKSTDIYSLGATLYETLTMRTVFQGDTIFNIMFQIMHNDPVQPRVLNPEIPIDLEAICLKCLEKKATKRYVNMKLFANDLNCYLEDKPVSAKPVTRLTMLRKFLMRNKVFTGLAFTILFISILFVRSLAQKHTALQEKEKALVQLTEKERILKAQEEDLQKKKEELKKNIQKHMFSSLKRHLYFANTSLQKGESQSAMRELGKAQKAYEKSDFAVAKDCLEFRFLEKQIDVYPDFVRKGGSFLRGYKDHFLVMQNMTGAIYLASWQNKYIQKRITNVQGWILHAAISPNKETLAIINANAKGSFLSFLNPKTLQIIKEYPFTEGNRDRFCYFYSDEILIVGGRFTLDVWKIDSGFQKVQSIDLLSDEVTGYSKLSKVHSITKNSQGCIFFVYGACLCKHNIKSRKTDFFFARLPKEVIKSCLFDAISNKMIISTDSGKVAYVNDDGKVVFFKDQHNSMVSCIQYNDKFIFTSSDQGEIFIWHRSGKLYKKIFHVQDEIQEFILQQDTLICLNRTTIHKYKWNKPVNPVRIDIDSSNNLSLKENRRHITHSGGDYVSYSLTWGNIAVYQLSKKRKKDTQTWHKNIYSFYDDITHKLFYINYNQYDIYRGHEQLTKNIAVDIYEDGKFIQKQNSKISSKIKFLGAVHRKKNHTLYFYSRKGVIASCDLQTGKIKEMYYCELLEKEQASVCSAAISTDQDYIAFAFHYKINNTKYISLFHIPTKKYVNIPMDYSGENTRIQFAKIADKESLIICFQEKIQVWDFDSLRKQKKQYFELKNYRDYINSFAIVADEERLIAVDKASRILVWYIGTLPSHLEEEKAEGRLLLGWKSGKIIEDCVYLDAQKKLITVGNEVCVWDLK